MGILSRLLGRTAPTPRPAPRPTIRIETPPDDGRRESWYVKASEMPPDRYVTAPGVMPPLHLVAYDDILRLCEDETGLLIGPTNRAVGRAGIYVSNLRGEGYHQAECRAGDFTPGTSVRLVREPDNPHDPNAVAIHDLRRDGVAAYLDRTRAKAVSKVLDSGRPLAAVSTCGTKAGQSCESITVVAAGPDVLAHLLSPRSRSLTAPAHLR